MLSISLRADAVPVRYLRHLERVTSLVLPDCDGRYLTNRVVNHQRYFLPDRVPCHLIHLTSYVRLQRSRARAACPQQGSRRDEGKPR